MKLVKIENGGMYRYTFIDEVPYDSKVWTLDYFEDDEVGYDSSCYSDVKVISKDAYLTNKNSILTELEDAILCFDNEFSRCKENWELEEEDFLKAEHNFILANCF